MGTRFCHDGGMNMAMAMQNGFQLGFYAANPDTNYCIAFLSENAPIDTPTKYVVAIIGAFAFAFVTEGLKRIRKEVQSYQIPLLKTAKMQVFTKNAALSLLFGVQMTIAYMLMLLAMLYESLMFTFMILGFAVGYFVFMELPDDVQKQIKETEVTHSATGAREIEVRGQACCCNSG